MEESDEGGFCFLFVGTVGGVLVGRMMAGEDFNVGRGFDIEKPETSGGVAQSNDSGDVVLDDAGKVFFQQNIITAVVTELTEGNERTLEVRLDQSSSSMVVELKREVGKVQ